MPSESPAHGGAVVDAGALLADIKLDDDEYVAASSTSKRTDFIAELKPERVPEGPIRVLLDKLLGKYAESSVLVREGLRTTVEIIRATEQSNLMRGTGRRFVLKALEFLSQASEADPLGANERAPGSAHHLLVRTVISAMNRFWESVSELSALSIVGRSVERPSSHPMLYYDATELRERVTAARTHLGLAHAVRRLAAAGEGGAGTGGRPSILSVPAIKDQCDDILLDCFVQTSGSAGAKPAMLPDFEAFLNLLDCLRGIREADQEEEEAAVRETRKRAREDDDGATVAPAARPLIDPSILSALETQFDSRHIAFENRAQLLAWKDQQRAKIRRMVDTWRVDTQGRSAAEITASFLALLAMLCLCNIQDNAIYIGEIFVTFLRDRFDASPTDSNRVRLAYGLAALSLLMQDSAAEDGDDIALAVADGVRILAPLFRRDPARYCAPMAALKSAYAAALDTASGDLVTVELRRPVLRQACAHGADAIRIHRFLLAQNPDDMDLKCSMARALLTRAVIGKHYAHELWRQADPRARVPEPDVEAILKDPAERALFEEALKASDEALHIFRELACENGPLYDHLVLYAFSVNAELAKDVRPLDVVSQVYAEYADRMQTITRIFPGQIIGLDVAFSDWAGTLRRRGDLTGAAETLQKAIKVHDRFLAELPDWEEEDSSPWQWALMSGQCADLLVMLERYDEAMEAGVSATEIAERGAAEMFSGASAAAGHSVRGICLFKLGKYHEAKRELQLACDQDEQEEQVRDEQRLGPIIGSGARLALTTGYLGAVQSALGQHRPGLETGKKAIKRMRERLGPKPNRDTYKLSMDNGRPEASVLPRLLLLQAATLCAMERYDEALEMLDECLKLSEESQVAYDASFVKTAYLIKARLHEIDEEVEKAAEAREKADGISQQGFLPQLGCAKVLQEPPGLAS